MSAYLEVCEKAIRLAGQVLLDRFGRVTPRRKGPSDLVTEADLASQDLVRRTLYEAFPGHLLIGEEDSTDHQKSLVNQDFRWIVDPLDGTTNYVHGVPYASVSLALQQGEKLLVGAVFNPFSGECFTAASGQGAWLNGTPIHTSGVRSLSEALVAAGFPAAVAFDAPDLRIFNEIVLSSQAVRRTGSAALNLAYVAAGRFDAGWSVATKIWDSAAGWLLVREAGGIATALTGDKLGVPTGPFVVAATPDLHRELLSIIRRTVRG